MYCEPLVVGVTYGERAVYGGWRDEPRRLDVALLSGTDLPLYFYYDEVTGTQG